jgi:DhnA family fructose-bisphosphate aldolase class Ia
LTSKEMRLSRLFPESGQAVVAAMDHGQTFGPMPGLVDFTAAAERLKEADGVLMAPQMLRFSGNLFRGKGSPTAIVRLNWNTIHCEPWHYRQAHIVKAMSVESAVAAGADVVLASLVLRTGDEAHDAANVQGFAALAEESARLGIPLIGEVFPVAGLRERPAEFHGYIVTMCRIICELGADAIKTFYTGDRFEEVVTGVPIPVLALGPRSSSRRSRRWSWPTGPHAPAPPGWSSAATCCRRRIRRSSSGRSRKWCRGARHRPRRARATV